jgi:hypothetical protein
VTWPHADAAEGMYTVRPTPRGIQAPFAFPPANRLVRRLSL